MLHFDVMDFRKRYAVEFDKFLESELGQAVLDTLHSTNPAIEMTKKIKATGMKLPTSEEALITCGRVFQFEETLFFFENMRKPMHTQMPKNKTNEAVSNW